MPEDLKIEVAPNELCEPCLRADVLAAHRFCVRDRRQLADGNGAKAIMCTQIRDAFDRWKVAGIFVVRDTVNEVVPKLRSTRHAACQYRFDVSRLETHRCQ